MWSSPRPGRMDPDFPPMAEAASIPRFRSRAEHLADEALCLSLGAGLTFVLFMEIAHFEMVKAVAPPPEIEALRAVSAIFEPPPPKVEDHPEPLDISMPLTGIDIEASDSPVKLAVVPPDLDKRSEEHTSELQSPC